MQETTGQPPRMWGPNIIGFGSYHYTYASGCEGDVAAAGFSPRTANLVIYGFTDTPGAAELLENLGHFKSGTSCIYLNKLADIDAGVLRRLVALSYQHLTTTAVQPLESRQNQLPRPLRSAKPFHALA